MSRPVTLFTGQWTDLPLAELCEKAVAWGYDGLELACWGDHFDVARVLADDDHVARIWSLLDRHGLVCHAISNHLVGQAICDPIDERHRAILPARVWGDGEPEGVRRRAAGELMDTARAARVFFDAAPAALRRRFPDAGERVCGFTGSPIWHLAYAFPPVPEERIEAGFAEFGERFLPVLEVFDGVGLDFALEVHPTEIAFDCASLERAIRAVSAHQRFRVNFDPSHLGYQRVDALELLRAFRDRIAHVHVKDAWWSDGPGRVGVFGGHTPFGADGRCWDFRSPGRGRIDFESIVRLLDHIGYRGPLSVEWEDPMMDREHGAEEACAFVRRLGFPRSDRAFDDAFVR